MPTHIDPVGLLPTLGASSPTNIIQLQCEYVPAPTFNIGTLSETPEDDADLIRNMLRLPVTWCVQLYESKKMEGV
jgi:hypothetical protein